MKDIKEIIEENKKADEIAGRTKEDIINILTHLIRNIEHGDVSDEYQLVDLEAVKKWVQKQ